MHQDVDSKPHVQFPLLNGMLSIGSKVLTCTDSQNTHSAKNSKPWNSVFWLQIYGVQKPPMTGKKKGKNNNKHWISRT